MLLIKVSGAPDNFRTSLVMGQQDPPRGWLSRVYGEIVPTPSWVVEGSATLPLTMDTWIVPQESEAESLEALRTIAEKLP